jgi:hypothetical protein
MAFVEAGTALAIIKREKLFEADYGSFEDYCRLRWGFEKSKVKNWMAAAELFNSLAALPDVSQPENEAQIRPLRGLSPLEAQIAWQGVVAASRGRRITEAAVRRAIKELQLIPPKAPCTRVNKGEQKRVVAAAVVELLLLARKRAAYEDLIEKLEKLDGHIQRLFAPTRPK